MNGYAARVKWEHRERMTAAWHGAAMGRAKKMPPLDKILGAREGKKKRAQTPEEMLGVMTSLSAGIAK